MVLRSLNLQRLDRMSALTLRPLTERAQWRLVAYSEIVHFELMPSAPTPAPAPACIHTAHGMIETPVFMPVGTQATVKGVMQRDHRRRAGRQHHPGQHLSLVPAPRPRADPQAGRTAPLHVLAARDPHRLGRFPGLQPERPAQDLRRRRAVPLAPGWRRAPVHARIHRRCPARARQRHHDAARRVPGISRQPRSGESSHAPHGALGAFRLPAL